MTNIQKIELINTVSKFITKLDIKKLDVINDNHSTTKFKPHIIL